MHAYAHRYEAQEVLLVYPHHAGLGPWVARRAEFGLMDGAGAVSRRVSVATVDLTGAGGVRAALLEVVAAAAARAQPREWLQFVLSAPSLEPPAATTNALPAVSIG
jgi:hypothetical protein